MYSGSYTCFINTISIEKKRRLKKVNISGIKKGNPIAMTKEQYDSWTGNENENEI